MAFVLVDCGQGSLPSIMLPKEGSLKVGRDPDLCKIVLHDTSVSRKHAKLSVDAEGKVTLQDLQSTKGTQVNGTKIEPLSIVFLSLQDQVTFGDAMVFRLELVNKEEQGGRVGFFKIVFDVIACDI
jgi:pSer/pThr/pTyr-binding forkhead associated (FHA) protein